MAYEHITLHAGGPVARLVLDRPERRNPLSLSCLREIADALTTVGADRSVRVLVVEANGPAFSAGHDIAEMSSHRDAAFFEELFGTCVEMMLQLQRLPQPAIAKVHGVATAAGCQLVAACDLAVASDTSRFATPGVNIGLFCSTPMVPLQRSVGRKRAMEMLLTGEMIDAATALGWGLVNRVVTADALDAEVNALADRLMTLSPEVLAIGKRVFYAQDQLPEADAYAVTCPVMVDNAQIDDAQEGMRAFVDKRAPQWTTP